MLRTAQTRLSLRRLAAVVPHSRNSSISACREVVARHPTIALTYILPRRGFKTSCTVLAEHYKFDFNRSARSLEPSPQSNGPPETPQPQQTLPAKIALSPTTLTGLGGTFLEDTPSNGLVLSSPALLVTRRLEWANLVIGFEQANKYDIRNDKGEIVGFLAEEDTMGKTILRNVLRTHRSFRATVMDPSGNTIFVIERPAYFISSTLYVKTAAGDIIGEVHQRYHVFRRKYNVFIGKKQFARIDMPMLSFIFDLEDEEGKRLARVDKDFTGFMRELFTDGRQYIVRFDPSVFEDVGRPLEQSTRGPLDFDQRALVLGLAVSIDFDYYSLHSGSGMGVPIPIIMPIPGGGGGGEGAPAGEVPGGAPVPLPPPGDSPYPAEPGTTDPSAPSDSYPPAWGGDEGGFKWDKEKGFDEEPAASGQAPNEGDGVGEGMEGVFDWIKDMLK
mmetsp:Transcript_16644/g.27533  ORF Transcript_16644/g.27533 Transcript_16644/m.27533 type:complete len:444 (-) Transcript_16644:533-1864(-)